MAIASLVSLASCASAPTIGVRTGFENRTLPRIAVAPISSTSRFGTPPEHWRALEADVSRRIETDLEALGFDVVDAEELRDELERQDAWERFTELLNFDDGLDTRFEPSLYAPATAEILTLRELSIEGAVSAPAVLFTEIVYHSRGECTVDARTHSRFAVVVDRAGNEVDAKAASPCVVTHIQAKLVDVKSAGTMWHNRVLRELRAPEVAANDDRTNASATTHAVIAGDYGIAPFAPGASRRQSTVYRAVGRRASR